MASLVLGTFKTEGLGGEVGEDERGLVELGSVVLELSLEVSSNLTDGLLGEGRSVLGGKEEAEGARGVGGDLGDGVGDSGEDLADELLHGRDELEVEPDALSLGTEDTVLSEGLLNEGEVLLVEKGGSGSSGIRRVGDDNVELVLVLLDELKTITDVDGDALILVSDGGVGEELAGGINDDLINLANVELLDGRVASKLTEDTSITSSDDQNLLGVGVGEHGQVGEGLLVRALVTLSDLDGIVQNQSVSVSLGLEDQDILLSKTSVRALGTKGQVKVGARCASTAV